MLFHCISSPVCEVKRPSQALCWPLGLIGCSPSRFQDLQALETCSPRSCIFCKLEQDSHTEYRLKLLPISISVVFFRYSKQTLRECIDWATMFPSKRLPVHDSGKTTVSVTRRCVNTDIVDEQSTHNARYPMQEDLQVPKSINKTIYISQAIYNTMIVF